MARRRSRGSKVSSRRSTRGRKTMNRSKVSRKRSRVSRKRSRVSRKRSRVSRKRSKVSRKRLNRSKRYRRTKGGAGLDKSVEVKSPPDEPRYRNAGIYTPPSKATRKEVTEHAARWYNEMRFGSAPSYTDGEVKRSLLMAFDNDRSQMNAIVHTAAIMRGQGSKNQQAAADFAELELPEYIKVPRR